MFLEEIILAFVNVMLYWSAYLMFAKQDRKINRYIFNEHSKYIEVLNNCLKRIEKLEEEAKKKPNEDNNYD